MGEHIQALGHGLKVFVETTGPVGGLVAGVLVALALGLIAFARSASLFDDTRTAAQKTGFQERLISQVDKLVAREAALERTADRLERENDALRESAGELKTQVVLMHVQLRRAIDLLRAVQDGRMPVSAIDAFEQEVTAPEAAR